MAEHFRQDHFLCEEGECEQEKFFTNAFRTEIDYKAHCSQNHSKSMSKAAARAARTIEMDYNYTPRESGRGGGRGGGGRDRGGCFSHSVVSHIGPFSQSYFNRV